MHEFPEVQAMVRKACAKAPQGTRIRRITLAIGEASGHDPEHILQHFAEASRNTLAEGAQLEFIREELAAVCPRCGKVFEPRARVFACAGCGGVELVITAGNDVHLVGIQT